MYIVRWLMGHPIIAAWFLAAIAILLNFGEGEKAEHLDLESNEKIHLENQVVGHTSSNISPTAPADLASQNVGNDQNTSSVTDVAKSTIDLVEITNTSSPGGLELSNGSIEDKAAIDQQSLGDKQIATSASSTGLPQSEVIQSASVESGESASKATSDLGQMTIEDKAEAVIDQQSLGDKQIATSASSTGLPQSEVIQSASVESGESASKATSDLGQMTIEDKAKAAIDQQSLGDKQIAMSASSTGLPQSEVIQSASVESGESASRATSDLGQMTTEEMLLMAREAYWNNGLDEASQIYQELIKLEPQVIEHRGELGNVYWRQGYPKKAAELYSEISIPMIEQGEAERVANMIGFIGLFFPDRASEIHQRLQSVKTERQEINK